MPQFKHRIAKIEQRLTPLQRAHLLIAQGTPPEQWPDEELESYCTTYCQDLKHLSDAELDALIDGTLTEIPNRS